jgi:small subunit ribosomal protein S4
METSLKYSKNNEIGHDVAVFQFLERRMDVFVLRAGLANTIMQARQMVVHGHFTLNAKKHNVHSTFLKIGDRITVKEGLKNSPLYNAQQESAHIPTWIKMNNKNLEIEVLDLPRRDEVTMPVDVLKVIEYYARA